MQARTIHQLEKRCNGLLNCILTEMSDHPLQSKNLKRRAESPMRDITNKRKKSDIEIIELD